MSVTSESFPKINPEGEGIVSTCRGVFCDNDHLTRYSSYFTQY